MLLAIFVGIEAAFQFDNADTHIFVEEQFDGALGSAFAR